MNVLCICYEYPPIGGGGAPVCQGICESIASAGHCIDVVTSAMSDLPMRENRNGVELHRVRCRRKHRHYTTTFELISGLLPAYRYAMSLTRSQSYDLIHCHFVVPSGVVACAVAQRTGLPYIITAHGSDIPNYNPDRFGLMHRLIRPAWRTILRRATAITTPSHFLKDLLQEHLDVPVDIIPNGYTPPDGLTHTPKRNRMLVVTRMFERKGIQHFIEALRDLDTDWEVCIVGDGPYLATLKTLTQQAGVKAEFLGYVQGEPLLELYRSSRIFVMPSSRENFPIVLLEAMAAGCAVITTTGSGCEEVVGPAAITVEPKNPQAIRTALVSLINHDDQIERLRHLALKRVERFSWQRIGHEFETLFTRYVRSDDSLPGTNVS